MRSVVSFIMVTLSKTVRFVSTVIIVLSILAAVGCTSSPPTTPPPVTPPPVTPPPVTPPPVTPPPVTPPPVTPPPVTPPPVTPPPVTPPPVTPPPVTAYTVNISSKAVIGNYLVDGRGRTLYYTISDRPGYSNLPDETLSSWPVFYVSDIVVPPSLNAADFGSYTRDNKVRQTTYKGYPLYYFFQDRAAGDTTGNQLGMVWFAVSP